MQFSIFPIRNDTSISCHCSSNWCACQTRVFCNQSQENCKVIPFYSFQVKKSSKQYFSTSFPTFQQEKCPTFLSAFLQVNKTTWGRVVHLRKMFQLLEQFSKCNYKVILELFVLESPSIELPITKGGKELTSKRKFGTADTSLKTSLPSSNEHFRKVDHFPGKMETGEVRLEGWMEKVDHSWGCPVAGVTLSSRVGGSSWGRGDLLRRHDDDSELVAHGAIVGNGMWIVTGGPCVWVTQSPAGTYFPVAIFAAALLRPVLPFRCGSLAVFGSLPLNGLCRGYEAWVIFVAERISLELEREECY